MRIFTSWSGAAAKDVAEFLRAWVPRVLANKVSLFVSSQDISKGDRGMNVIAAELESIDFGLVVLTRENVDAAWINFEAGALGKSVGLGRVVPLLLDLTDADVRGPLTQFQMARLPDRVDMLKLAFDINGALEDPLPRDTVEVLFDRYWPEVEPMLSATKILPNAKTQRTNEDLLEEILQRVRRIERVGPKPITRGAAERQERALLEEVDEIFGAGTRVSFQTDSFGTVNSAEITVISDNVDVEGVGEVTQHFADRHNVNVTIFHSGKIYFVRADGPRPAGIHEDAPSA